MSYDSQYQSILRDLMERGCRSVNKRTGHETTALPNRVIEIDPLEDGFPLLGLRKMPVSFFLWEVLWFFAGSDNPDFFPEGTGVRKVWDEFREADGRTPCITGYRWRRHFGRDQIGRLIELFKKDPTSRHGLVLSWDPSADGLGDSTRKNIPCCYGVTFSIIGGRLCMTLLQRSADYILGAPHDMAGHAVIQAMLAQTLGVQPGHILHVMTNCHIYDCHYDAAEELLNREPSRPFIQTTFSKDAGQDIDRLFAGEVDMEERKSMVDRMRFALEAYSPTGKPIKGLEVVQ